MGNIIKFPAKGDGAKAQINSADELARTRAELKSLEDQLKSARLTLGIIRQFELIDDEHRDLLMEHLTSRWLSEIPPYIPQAGEKAVDFDDDIPF